MSLRQEKSTFNVFPGLIALSSMSAANNDTHMATHGKAASARGTFLTYDSGFMLPKVQNLSYQEDAVWARPGAYVDGACFWLCKRSSVFYIAYVGISGFFESPLSCISERCVGSGINLCVFACVCVQN